MNYYLDVLKKYAVFSGRATRAEYWYFVLFNILIAIVLGVIAEMIKLPIISIIYALAIIVPSLAVLVRRLHDIGKSGWWFFIELVPVIGFIWLIVLLATGGNSGANKYGADPKVVKAV